MLYHKECKNDEVFVGNTKTDNDCNDLVVGKVHFRKGIQAYDIHGEKLNPDYMRPLFIDKEDYSKYDRIMTSQIRQ